MVRDSRAEYKVYGNVFDNFTINVLQKLKDKGLFSELKSPISIGKESNVFSADSDRGIVVAKIYRLHTCDFNRMYDYIKYDERYSTLRKNRRKIIFSWAQREYRNLYIAREAGVRVPTPLAIMNHVLVLEFIGNEERAPRLKDRYPTDPEKFFNETVNYVKRLYKAGLVHGDLSPFNILNLDDKPVFIDFSQGTTVDSSRSDEYLSRDIKNICTFFRKLGVKCDEDAILADVKKSRPKKRDGFKASPADGERVVERKRPRQSS